MKKRKILLSGILSIVAFSLFTTVNAESYAVGTAPETFTTKPAGRLDHLGDENYDAVLENWEIARHARYNDGQNVIDYHTTDNTKIFCTDRKIPYNINGVAYNKVGPVEDKVLAYIIGLSDSFYRDNFEATAVAENSTLAVTKKMEQSWLTQVAIWKYNASKNPDDTFTTLIRLTDNSTIYEAGVVLDNNSGYNYSKRAGALWKAADQLIEQAKSAASITTFEFSFEGKYELDEDAKTIKTGIITSPYANFSVDLSKAPEGTKIYDESGNELDSSNVTTTKFYLVFPINNTEEYSFDFDISATTINSGAYEGYKYTTNAGDYQPMMLVVYKPISGGIHFEGSNITDTASMTSNSIYLVGFLILIAGVTMIYVNVRPQAMKEQI